MDTLVLLASTMTAAAVVLVSYGVWSLATAERERVSWRVTRSGIGIRSMPSSATDVRVQGRSSPVFTPVDRALSRYSWAERSRLQLQKAEVNLHLSEFIALRVLSTFAAFAIPTALAVSNGRMLFAYIGIGAAVFTWWQFGSFVRRKLNRRLRKLEDHLEEALISISGSLRAGFSFPQACQLSMNQLQWPLKDELQEMLEEVNVGASLDDALRNMAQRIDSYEVDIAVNAVLVQRQVGGSLAEILENVAKTIRDRGELRGHLMALTAQQRLSAYFVAGVPVFMCGLLSLTSWDFMKPLFVTLVGNILIAIGIFLDMIGFLVMRRLTRIDF